MTEEDVRLFEKGVHIGDEKPTMPTALEILSVQKERRKEKIKEQKILPETKNETDEKEDGYSEIYLTIKEGRFHQVKRMFRAVGKASCLFKKDSVWNIDIGSLSLKPGQYRKLTEEEVEQLC